RWQSGPNVLVSIERLRRILEYLRAEDIRMYRMSSDFVPYATHPNLPQFHGQIDPNAQALADIGRVATEHDVRLSLHPTLYDVLHAVGDTTSCPPAAALHSQPRLHGVTGMGSH